MFDDFYRRKTVLVTGHTGFKGSWLALWLSKLGAKVVGYALPPARAEDNYVAAGVAELVEDFDADVRDQATLSQCFREVQPDVVFHLAAQSLVLQSYQEPAATFDVNVQGTVAVLEAARLTPSVRSIVIVTTDKCYDNRHWPWPYRETDALGGHDPYSASKACAELVAASYRAAFFGGAKVATARAGNVIGAGDWADNRIVPDCVKAWSSGNVVELRNPHSTRPWQHVLEPLSGYLSLAVALSQRPELHAEPFNFGPRAQQNHSVLELVQQMALHWDQVRWEDASKSAKGPYESGLLKLNCDKALHYLRWHAVMDFEDTVGATARWYRAYYQQPETVAATTREQIGAYTELARKQGIPWAG